MKLQDLLHPEDIFNPSVFYEGEWFLGGNPSFDQTSEDYLLLNAKKNGGENAYRQYLEKYYYKPMKEIVLSDSIAHSLFPKIVLGVDEKTNRRIVHFSLEIHLFQLLLSLIDNRKTVDKFHELTTTEKDEKVWISFVREELRKDRAKYHDFLEHQEQSPYFSFIQSIYTKYQKDLKQPYTLQKFAEAKETTATKMITGLRYYPSFFEKTIDTDALLEAFDYDTFCLIAAKSVLDTCLNTEESIHLVDNSIWYIRIYLEAVKKLREENPQYDCSMVMIDEISHRKKIITIHDIQKEYDRLLARHDEFSFIVTNPEEIKELLREQGIPEEFISSFDIGKKEGAELLLALFQNIEKNKALAAEWEIIPKGRKESSETESHLSFMKSSSLSEEEKIRRMLIGKEYLENSHYQYKVIGKNKFEGYIGYVFSNGRVIFEKYYENLVTKKVASSVATYSMRLDNFIEMSKKSKQEIIHMIHQDSSIGVRRIFHREDMERWKSQIDQEIHGMDYNDEVIHYIDELISRKELEKNGVKE